MSLRQESKKNTRVRHNSRKQYGINPILTLDEYSRHKQEQLQISRPLSDANMVGSSYILYHSLEFTQVYATLLYHPAHFFAVPFSEFIVVSISVPKLVWSLEPAFGAQSCE